MVQTHIKALVFDLDGTLYVSGGLGKEINDVACRYIADMKGIDLPAAEALIRETRAVLTADGGTDATLSSACIELGGNLPDLHRRFSQEIRPEQHIRRDERVGELLRMLAGGFELYLYTNNNRSLSRRITDILGVTDIFQRIFTIEDRWAPKPDRQTLEGILRDIRKTPAECLFVGDRFDVDLRLPAQLGCSVCLVQSVEELFPLCKLLHEESL